MKSLFAVLMVAGALGLSAGPAFAAGAFAVDTERDQAAGEEGYGIGWGDSREEAGRAAMRECRKAGNDDCKVVARFDNCGAYAANRTSFGVGWGSTKADAKAMALDQCPRCRIVLAECE